MNTMTEVLFKLTTRRPFMVILVVILLSMAAAYGGSKLTFKGDYRVFFGDENPQLVAFENTQATFTKNDNVAFIVAPKDNVVFKQKTLEAIHALTAKAWQIPYSNRVDSITNYQHTTADGDNLLVEDLVLEPELIPQLNLEKIKNIVLSEPLILKKLISEDSSVTIVNTTIQLPGIDQANEVSEIVTKVRSIQSEIQKDYPELDIYLSGMVMMNNAFTEASIKDSSTLIPLMFAVVALVIILLLRTFSGSLATIIVVAFSIMGTMGLVGWLGFFLTGPSASAPTVVMTLAVADCIHILTTMLYEMRQGVKKKEAILSSLRINFQPILLTSLTTAIGFLSMNFSDSPPFNDLGNFVAIGVMLAFTFSITLFPALLMILPIRVKLDSEKDSDFMDNIATFVITKKRILLPAFSVLIIVFSIYVPKNVLNDDFVKYFDTSVPFRQSTDFMQDNVSGLTTLEIAINSGESSGINTPEYLQLLSNFSDWVRTQEETENVSILSDVLRRLNKNMHGDDDSYYQLPNNRELSAQYLLLYELSLPYGLDLNNQIDVDKSATRIVVTSKSATSSEIIEFEQRIKQWFTDNSGGLDATVSSPAIMFSHIGQRNIQSMLLGTTGALILISILLAIALRSIKFGLISLVPNLVPAAIAFGMWYFIDGQVGLGLSVVTGMTLGIVVDDTVHFLSKYLYARRNKNKDSVGAVRYAFASVGRALWATSIVLFAGFMVLAQSSFKLNADMGLLTGITILVALIIDFFFLPPLLMKLDGGNDDTAPEPTKNTQTHQTA